MQSCPRLRHVDLRCEVVGVSFGSWMVSAPLMVPDAPGDFLPVRSVKIAELQAHDFFRDDEAGFVGGPNRRAGQGIVGGGNLHFLPGQAASGRGATGQPVGHPPHIG